MAGPAIEIAQGQIRKGRARKLARAGKDRKQLGGDVGHPYLLGSLVASLCQEEGMDDYIRPFTRSLYTLRDTHRQGDNMPRHLGYHPHRVSAGLLYQGLDKGCRFPGQPYKLQILGLSKMRKGFRCGQPNAVACPPEP